MSGLKEDRNVVKEIDGIVCHHCGKTLNDVNMRKLVLNRLIMVRDNMKKKKQHISNYGQFAIVEELIKIFKEIVNDYGG